MPMYNVYLQSLVTLKSGLSTVFLFYIQYDAIWIYQVTPVYKNNFINAQHIVISQLDPYDLWSRVESSKFRPMFAGVNVSFHLYISSLLGKVPVELLHSRFRPVHICMGLGCIITTMYIVCQSASTFTTKHFPNKYKN